MSPRLIPKLALFLAFAILFCTGCAKAKISALINPDGSGKLGLVVGLRNDVYSQKYGNKKKPLFTLDDFNNAKGIVAWLRPQESKSGGYHYFEFVGYFEDVNKVKFPLNNPDLTFRKKRDGTFTLKFRNFIQGDEKIEENNTTRDLLRDVEIAYAFKLPGKIEEIKKWKAEGRVVSRNLGIEDIFEVQQKKKGWIEAEFRMGAVEQAAEQEQENFKKELEQAKKEWEKYKKELEKQDE